MSDQLSFIVFGATGDLAKNRIFPALQSLGIKSLAYGRKDFVTSENVQYIKGELSEIENKLQGVSITHAYVALPPEQFEEVLSGLASLQRPDLQIALEKPFGSSFAHAQSLYELIRSLNLENNIYLVDHYLGKQSVMNAQVFSEEGLESVDIDFIESVDIGSRGKFYDKVGTIRDVVQNHVLALVTKLLGIKPKELDCIEVVANSITRGQYEGFKETEGVSHGSQTETYIECELMFGKIPLHIRAGKALDQSKVSFVAKYSSGEKKLIQIDKSDNAYIEIIKDFLGDKLLGISFHDAFDFWKIAEEIIIDAAGVPLKIYPKGTSPDIIKAL